jgi:hypothetical protein
MSCQSLEHPSRRSTAKTWTVAILALILVVPSATIRAQVAGSFDQLPVLVRRGETVSVTDVTGRTIKGRIVDLSSSGLVILVAGSRHALGHDEIQSIRKRGPDRLRNGAWLGFGIGAAIGWLLAAQGAGADSGYGDQATALAPILIGAALGTGVGAGLDAMFDGQHVIYSRSKTNPTK